MLPPFLQPTAVPQPGASTIAAGGLSPPSGNTVSGFIMQTQGEDKWCWAAVGSSVADAYGTGGWSQCRIAEAEFAHHGWACCAADASDPAKCNQPWHLDRALARVGHFDRMTATTAPFPEIRTEINARRPVGCRVAWAHGGAHFLAIAGWSIATDGTYYVDIADPFYGPVQKTYAGLVGGYRSAGDTWTHTYFTSPTAGPTGGSVSASPKNAWQIRVALFRSASCRLLSDYLHATAGTCSRRLWRTCSRKSRTI